MKSAICDPLDVLYFSSLYSSFIHNQILELFSKRLINPHVFFLINLYPYIVNHYYRKTMDGIYLYKSIPENIATRIYYPGLPKRFLQEFYGHYLYLILSRKSYPPFKIIHSHSLYPAGYVGMKFADKWKIPFILTTHGTDFYTYSGSNLQYPRNQFLNGRVEHLIRKILTRADYVIAVSPTFAEDILTFQPSTKIKVIENSYDSCLFSPGDKYQARKKLGLISDQKIILSVGYFEPVKGHIFLIQAMKTVRTEFPDSMLYLVGSGKMESEYRKIISEYSLNNNVKLIEGVSQGDLPLWYRSADVFVLPSLSETFGISLIEAMASGLPVIATKTQGPKNIINNEKDGFLVPVKDSDSTAKMIIELFHNEELRVSVSSRAVASVKNKYQRNNKKIFELYLNVIEKYEKNSNINY